jgi:hypothetical protein
MAKSMFSLTIAGIYPLGPAHEMTEEQFDRVSFIHGETRRGRRAHCHLNDNRQLQLRNFAALSRGVQKGEQTQW